MRTILLIVGREVRERLNTKSFRLFTGGLFLLVLFAIVAVDRAPDLFGESGFELGVANTTPDELHQAIRQYAALQDIEVELVQFETEQDALRLLEQGEIDAYVWDASMTYRRSESTRLTAVVNGAVYAHELSLRLAGLGLSGDEAMELLSAEPVEVVLQDPGQADAAERQFIGFLAALALYVTIAVYGNWILTGVVEEKSTRVVEVLLGLVRPYELLAGKTLGILVVAVGQLLAGVAGGLAGLAIVGTSVVPAVALDVVLAAIPLYLLGLVLYSLIYAAAGAMVSRQADAQTAATPIVITLLVPYMFAAAFVPENPDGPAATALSIFPLTSALVMPARVATGSPAAVELAACYLLLIPTIMLIAMVGGRIYSGAILSGRRLGLGSLLAAVLRPGEAR